MVKALQSLSAQLSKWMSILCFVSAHVDSFIVDRAPFTFIGAVNTGNFCTDSFSWRRKAPRPVLNCNHCDDQTPYRSRLGFQSNDCLIAEWSIHQTWNQIFDSSEVLSSACCQAKYCSCHGILNTPMWTLYISWLRPYVLHYADSSDTDM